MKKLEISQELPNCDAETKSEPVAVGNMRPVARLGPGYHRLQSVRGPVPLRHGKAECLCSDFTESATSHCVCDGRNHYKNIRML